MRGGSRQHRSGKSGFNFNFYSALTIFPHCFVNHREEREQSNKSKIYSNKAPQYSSRWWYPRRLFFFFNASFASEFKISEGRRKPQFDLFKK